MPYIYRKVSGLEQQPKVGTHECVALVREYTNAPPSSTWRQGAAVLDNMNIEKGTAIATFIDGKYPNKKTGNHAALFLRFDPYGFWVMDQWRSDIGKPKISSRLIKVKPRGKASDNAAAYYIVE